MRVAFRRLAEVAEIFVGVPTKISKARQRAAGTPVLSVRALSDRGLDRRELIVAELNGRSVDKVRVRAGDVLVPARSTRLTAAVTPPGLDGTPINATLIGIRCHGELDPYLLAAYLRHPVGQAAIAEHSQSGTAQMNITVRSLGQLPVPVPQPKAQRQLVAMLSAADDAHQAAVEAAKRRYDLANQIVFGILLADAGWTGA